MYIHYEYNKTKNGYEYSCNYKLIEDLEKVKKNKIEYLIAYD